MYLILSFRRTALFLLSLVFFSTFLLAQNTTHPTIESLEVSYKDPEQILVDSLRLIRSQSVIKLKDETNITILHFKIINESDNNIVYQVDYNLNSPVIANEEGVILFKKDGNLCHVSSWPEMPLKLYLYQITTENSQGEISEVYSDFK